jgi:hypothetical protein
VLIRKATKFEREAQPLINKQKLIESEGLVKLASKFTNKNDFQKTFMRQSDVFISPAK